jgi:hypothetical protein
MNYRRGLQRVYAVFAAIWIAGILFAVLSGRWEPWHTPSAPISDKLPPPPAGYTPPPTPGWSFVDEPPKTEPPKTAKIDDIDETATQRMIIRQRWSWASGLSTIPPLIFYLILFYVVPWVYRGFKQKS